MVCVGLVGCGVSNRVTKAKAKARMPKPNNGHPSRSAIRGGLHRQQQLQQEHTTHSHIQLTPTRGVFSMQPSESRSIPARALGPSMRFVGCLMLGWMDAWLLYRHRHNDTHHTPSLTRTHAHPPTPHTHTNQEGGADDDDARRHRRRPMAALRPLLVLLVPTRQGPAALAVALPRGSRRPPAPEGA